MPTPTPEFLRQLFAQETLYLVAETRLPEPAVPAEPVAVPAPMPPVREPGAAVPVPVTAGVPAVPAEPVVPTFASLQVAQELLILTSQPSAEDRALLENILKAVGLSLSDVALLDIAELKGADFRDVLLAQSVRYFITFGVPLKRLNLDILLVPYQIRPVEGVQFLYADSFSILHTDKAKKRALWISLQTLFGLAA